MYGLVFNLGQVEHLGVLALVEVLRAYLELSLLAMSSLHNHLTIVFSSFHLFGPRVGVNGRVNSLV